MSSWWPTPPQEELLLAATQPLPDAIAALARWRARGVPYDTDHGSCTLLPLLYRHLEHVPVTAPFIQSLRGVYRRSWTAGRVLQQAGGDALRALDERGIDVMLLDGAALLASYDVDAGARPMGEFAVMVRDCDWQHALAALHRAGFAGASRRVHALRLRHPRFGATLALHAAPLECALGDADADFPWRRSRRVVAHGVDVHVPCAADQLVLAVANGVRRNAAASVLWIPDALVILRSGAVEWERVVEATRRWHATPAMRRALRYLDSRFAAAIPAGVMDRLDGSRITLREWMTFETRTRRRRILSLPLLLWRHAVRLRSAAADARDAGISPPRTSPRRQSPARRS